MLRNRARAQFCCHGARACAHWRNNLLQECRGEGKLFSSQETGTMEAVRTTEVGCKSWWDFSMLEEGSEGQESKDGAMEAWGLAGRPGSREGGPFFASHWPPSETVPSFLWTSSGKKKEKKKAEISFYFSMPKEESEHHVCSIGMQIVTSQSFALVVRNN